MKTYILIFFTFFVWISSDISGLQPEVTPKWQQLTFKYSPEHLDHLKSLPKPDHRITSKELAKLTDEVFYQIDTANLSGMDLTLIYPYLANAQKDFAWLSYLLTGDVIGDLGPVTLWTLQLFIPDASLSSVQGKNFDVYSSSIAAIVVNKAAERLVAERAQISNYPVKQEGNIWRPTSPGYIGLEFGSAKTWYLDSSKEFLAKPPSKDDNYWSEQCKEIQSKQKNLSGQEVEAVYRWAGLTNIHSASWEHMLANYLSEKDIPVVEQLYVRAVVFSAVADSNAAAFNSKYTYWVMRPSQKDPGVKPLITVPNHPSYPSAHSTISTTAAVLLSEFFPQDKNKWMGLAEEAGMSRIWGGIHYPCDHSSGKKLGMLVGQKVLQQLQQ